MLREVVNFRIIPEETIVVGSISTSFEFGLQQIIGSLTSQDKKELCSRIKKRTEMVNELFRINSYDSEFTEDGKKLFLAKLNEGYYTFILISPTTHGRYPNICFFYWVENTYENREYQCKTIFAFHNNDLMESNTNPIKLGNDPEIPSKVYWFYKEKIYWENDSLDVDSVRALINARESKKQRKVEFLKGPERKEKSRQFIEDDVKIAVWKRDGGKCVKCGSNKGLEFDHIIPVSMGGSSTERNLQLLCERCNREKGADLK